ncbi:MAG: alanyl-tRNA editing protein [Caldilineaceae bacterium]|nr:alanyl-tRNA editing protein [Caldilineaceae bacterium]
MTERLYFADPYRTEFEAHIVEATTWEEQPALFLDRTCFYPTSGGQPHDTGRLGGAAVVDVVAAADGRIAHLLAEPLGGELATVTGQVDWPRRYDHMQQHSGQHLLSQVFYELFGYDTLSVHFGAVESTIDFDVEMIDGGQIDEAERVANQLVYENRPISAYFVTDDEIASLPLRRPPKVSGRIRIVEIQAFDYSACGGTHCRTTGEIGPVKLLRLERQRGKSRVVFKCGWRGLTDYGQKHALITEAAALFSTEVGQVPTLIERNLEQIKELSRSVEQLTAHLLAREAQELLERGQRIGAARVVACTLNGKSVEQAKMIAHSLQEEPEVIALLTCAVDGKLTAIFARGEGVTLHMGNLLRGTLAQFGGGGGGRPEFAQGGGVAPPMRRNCWPRHFARLGSRVKTESRAPIH